MDIILLERIEKLGGLGEIVHVKNGYARNFLLPQRKALRATEKNKLRFEHEREALEKLNAERRSGAESNAENLEGQDFVLIRQASDTLQLYGSVSAKDIADAIIAAGVKIKRQQVRLDRPIKTLGIFDVRVAVHPEVIVTVRANIARSEEEAAIQAKGGSILPAHEQEVLDEQAEAAAAAQAGFESPEDELAAMADSDGADSDGAGSDEAGDGESSVDASGDDANGSESSDDSGTDSAAEAETTDT
jgi:large subunit ribosomal protein L9